MCRPTDNPVVLIGRERELADIRQRLDLGRSVVLLGEAGVGKTALAREVGRSAGREVAEAGAMATLSWHSYLPLRRLLDRLPRGDAAYVAEAVVRATGPRLLLLDDLQWADTDTLATIPSLVRRVDLIATVRRGDPGEFAALDALRSSGLETIEIAPLDAPSSAALAVQLRPELDAAGVDQLVARTGGNPLLIRELSATGEPSGSLRLALAARLRPLSADARRAMGMLALAGHPISASSLGPAGSELVAAGLAVEDGPRIGLRHALLGESIVAITGPDDIRELHRLLGQLLDDPGEQARHFLAGGERAAAHAAAVRAAEQAATRGERALHLELAGLSADGAGADELRISAADALADAQLDARALAVLEGVAGDDPEVAGRRHLYRARVLVGAGDHVAARAACEAGLALLVGSGSPIEARLALEDAQAAQNRVVLFDLDPAVARAKADLAVRLASRWPELAALAQRLVATIGLMTQTSGWDDEYAGALELARTQTGSDLEFRIALGFGFALVLSGRLDEAEAIYRSSLSRAQRDHLSAWEHALRDGVMGVLWHRGDYEAALTATRSSHRAGEPDQPEFYRCQVLSDLGRHEEAVDGARRMVERGLPTWQGLGEALWALSDAELAAGHPQAALDAANEAIRQFGLAGPTVFLQMTRGWALHDLGMPIDGSAIEAGQPIVAGAPHEMRGLVLLGDGRPSEAAAAFATAADAWRGRHARGCVRARWAQGEALRVAGDLPSAIAALEDAEAVAAASRNAPILRRIRRSLRRAGVRRSAPRGSAGKLTLRESEMLGLVAAGHTNAEIARRLGIARPSVERVLQTAMRKLGATTGVQAAALAAAE